MDLKLARKKVSGIHGREISFQRKKKKLKSGGGGSSSTAGDNNGDEPSKFMKDNIYGRCSNVSTRYEKLDRIGEGTYGVVYRARDLKTQKIVALKRCLPHHQATDGFPITTLREISLLRELRRHPHIVTLLETAVLNKLSGVFLVFEYAKHDLAQLVDNVYASRGKSPFCVAEVKRLSIQLIQAMDFLHKQNIVHRDIKLSNLLYDDTKGHLQIADFGLARRLGDDVYRHYNSSDDVDELEETCNFHEKDLNCLTPNVVSLWYRPPELLLGSETYSYGVDIWGIGCAISELFLGFPLIKGKNEMDQIQKIFELIGPPTTKNWPDLEKMPLIRNGSVEISSMHFNTHSKKTLLDQLGHLSNSGIQLMTNLLQYDPRARISTNEALSSTYLSIEPPLPKDCRLMPTFPSCH